MTLEQINRHPIPTEMPFFFLQQTFSRSQGVVCKPPECVSQALDNTLMKRNGILPAGTKLQVEVRVPSLVRVDSYTRIQNGRSVKVRSYYRRSWDADVVSVRIGTR